MKVLALILCSAMSGAAGAGLALWVWLIRQFHGRRPS